MKNGVTKTVDLSDYSDEQIKLMFDADKVMDMMRNIVAYLKDNRSYDRLSFESPNAQVLAAIKQNCVSQKIDPKTLGL